jgi:fatty-acid desaturase
VALLSWGEGWHNNHHAHPVSARHGLAWYEVDFNWYAIWVMNKLGMARQIYRAKLPSKKLNNEVVDVAIAGPDVTSELVSARP